MEKFLLVIPVKDLWRIGDATTRQLPLHCTVMSWFSPGSGADLAKLSWDIMYLAESLPDPITLVSERRSLFGPKFDIPVSVLAHNEHLLALHTLLLLLLGKHGCTFDGEHLKWVGAGFRPHVTDVGKRLLGTERWNVDSLALVERDENGKKRVIAIYALPPHRLST